jgi:hypothetical protein
VPQMSGRGSPGRYFKSNHKMQRSIPGCGAFWHVGVPYFNFQSTWTTGWLVGMIIFPESR